MKKPVKYVNPLGNEVPPESVSKFDKERDRNVRQILADWLRARAVLEAVGARTNARLEKIRKLAAKQAGVQLGGKKGYFQVRSFDGKTIVRFENVAVQEFDERLELAQRLVFEAIDDIAEKAAGEQKEQKEAVAKLRQIAADAFRPRGREGKIDRQRVSDLVDIAVDHPKWREAQKIILMCDRTIGHRAYVRVAVQADPKSKPEPVILDICKV